MKTKDVFPSKYLKAEDDIFASGEVIATIKDVVKEKLTSREKGDEDKPIMYFKELPKGLVMNKTNWGICEKLFGSDDSDNWLGERACLVTVDVDAFGDVVRAIRVKNQKPVVDRAALLVRYQKVYERGVKAGVDGIENYSVSGDMSENEIIELGKELKAKVEAAESF